MGLGKTLMSITLLWTLMNQGFSSSPQHSAVRKVVVVCPTSLVGNWDNEIRKWVGEHCPTFAVKTDPKRVIKTFLQHKGKGVLIVSYETQRLYSKLFESANKPAFAPRANISGGAKSSGALLTVSGENGAAVGAGEGGDTASAAAAVPATTTASGIRGHSANGVCDLLICDEAHKLKNADSGLAKSLSLLPARKRILLSGTPMQNELSEFFNMVNFCNPGVLGSSAEFKRRSV
jgi:DNA repair and recombination RAD54-like protein